MDHTKTQIGIREYIAIALALSSTKLTDDIPALIFQNGENSSWIITLLAGLISIFPIFLLIHMIVNHEKHCFFEVIYDACGRKLGSALLFFLWAVLTLLIIIVSATYVDVIGTMYFVKTPSLFIYVTFMAVCAYAAMKGIQSIGSVIWLVFVPMNIVFLLTVLLTLTKGSVDFIFPILGPGMKEIMSQSAMKVAIYIDFFFLCFLATYLNKAEDFRKGTWIAFVVVVVQLTIAILSYIMLFDYKTVQLLNYPHHEAVRFISFGLFANVELFVFPFWAMASFVRFSVYLYINSLIFGRIFRIEKPKFIIPSLTAIIICIGLIPEVPAFQLFELHTYALHASAFGVILIPIFLWTLLKIRKRANKNASTS